LIRPSHQSRIALQERLPDGLFLPDTASRGSFFRKLTRRIFCLLQSRGTGLPPPPKTICSLLDLFAALPFLNGNVPHPKVEYEYHDRSNEIPGDLDRHCAVGGRARMVAAGSHSVIHFAGFCRSAGIRWSC
jgi:hypothetical protein